MKRPTDDGTDTPDPRPAAFVAAHLVALSARPAALPDSRPPRDRRASLGGEAATQAPDPGAQDLSHPYIAVDMSRCIDCYRCVRICDEVQGQFVWHVRNRGVETRIVPDGPTLFESSCVSCGACVDTCPTGALEDRRSLVSTPSQWTRTVVCAVFVRTERHARAHRAVKPDARSAEPTLRQGRYAFDFARPIASPCR
jgi:formate dehydrogenase major subunit